MLTGKAKIGYLLANSGFIIFIHPGLKAGLGSMDGLDSALLVIATAFVLIGSALVRPRSIAGKFGRLVFGPPPLQSGRDWLALALIVIGSFMLPILLRNIWRGETLATQWPLFALTLLALAAGWFLSLSEVGQSRSPEK